MSIANQFKIKSMPLHNSAQFKTGGFKHAIVVIIAASILHPATEFIIDNVPLIDDVTVLMKVLRQLGADITLQDHCLTIRTESMQHSMIPPEFCEDVHGVLYLLPSLLTRFGTASLYECGGCQIGARESAGKRPTSHMFAVLKQFGFSCIKNGTQLSGHRLTQVENVTVDIMDYSEQPHVLTGPKISGATKTAILAAMADTKTQTLIKNPYQKPDVTELIRLLQLLNYDIHYSETALFIQRTPVVNKTKQVRLTLINDLSEVMTYITLAVFHGIEAKIHDLNVKLVQIGLTEEFHLLKKMGVQLSFTETTISVAKVTQLLPLDIIVTSIGIYSDHQPFFALLLSLAGGVSSIREQVWQDRFSYVHELNKLGFNILVSENQIQIHPHQNLYSETTLVAKDLRAAAVLLIAAMKAPGTTLLQGAKHLSRGYQNLQQTLLNCGADIVAMI